jgi:hypothetical protein
MLAARNPERSAAFDFISRQAKLSLEHLPAGTISKPGPRTRIKNKVPDISMGRF